MGRWREREKDGARKRENERDCRGSRLLMRDKKVTSVFRQGTSGHSIININVSKVTPNKLRELDQDQDFKLRFIFTFLAPPWESNTHKHTHTPPLGLVTNPSITLNYLRSCIQGISRFFKRCHIGSHDCWDHVINR